MTQCQVRAGHSVSGGPDRSGALLGTFPGLPTIRGLSGYV